MTKDDLKKLRQNLPKGSREIIAEKFGVTKGYVNNVLQGLRRNENILLAAAELLSEHRRKIKEATEFIESI